MFCQVSPRKRNTLKGLVEDCEECALASGQFRVDRYVSSMGSNVTCMSHCLDTALPADSIEFCPSPGLTHIFAVGTYKLEEGKANADDQQLEVPQRRGKCLLFEVDIAKSDNDDAIDCW